nr:hypothetical protein [Tanacetum cinerariifolium]
MTAILKQFQATPPPASVKAVEEICVTCGGAHPYYECLAADGNTFSELRDNIQGYVAAAAVNYNQGNSGYRPSGVANQIRPPGFAQPNVQNNQNRCSQPQGYNRGNNFNQDQSYQTPTQQNQVVPLSELEKIKRVNKANMKTMQTQINNVKNELRNEMKNSIQASMSNQTNELKNMMASFFRMNTASTLGLGSLPSNTIANPRGELKAITTRSGIVLDGHSVPIPPPFINPEVDERVEETLTNQDLAEYTIKVPPPLVQKSKPYSQRNFVLHINITLADALILIPKHQKMLKALLSNKEKLLELANTPLNENCSAVILKKLPEKLGDPGKFLFPCGFSELKCKALANLDCIPSDNSLPEYEIFYFDIEETNSGSTTIHADISLSDLECFNYNDKPDLGELTSIVDSGIHENVPSATNVNLPLEEDQFLLFAYVVWIFLSFLTYLVVPPNLPSFGNEDTIFDPGISNYHSPSLLPNVSHRCETFMKFNVYPKLLNESPMDILSSPCSPMEQ